MKIRNRGDIFALNTLAVLPVTAFLEFFLSMHDVMYVHRLRFLAVVQIKNKQLSRDDLRKTANFPSLAQVLFSSVS